MTLVSIGRTENQKRKTFARFDRARWWLSNRCGRQQSRDGHGDRGRAKRDRSRDRPADTSLDTGWPECADGLSVSGSNVSAPRSDFLPSLLRFPLSPSIGWCRPTPAAISSRTTVGAERCAGGSFGTVGSRRASSGRIQVNLFRKFLYNRPGLPKSGNTLRVRPWHRHNR